MGSALTLFVLQVIYQQAFGILGTLFIIMFLAHMLACFYYFVGANSEQLGNDVRVAGWVESEDNWMSLGNYADGSGVNTLEDCSNVAGQPDCRITTTTKYVTSMYYALNALESGQTTSERGYGVFAELVRDVILGLVAGLITTIAMSLSQSDGDAELKLKRLRRWMAAKKLPKIFQIRCASFDSAGLQAASGLAHLPSIQIAAC